MLERGLQRKLTWGFSIRAKKAMSTGTPIARGLLPERLVIPMTQQAGPAAAPIVEVGQRVRRGELIGRPSGPRSAAVHASSSGMVKAIREGVAPAVNGLSASLCVHLETDGEDEPAPTREWPQERAARIDAICNAGIVGLGGAVFSTAEKLRGDTDCELLILNGAECEPYISCDDMLMREHPLAVVRGALAMLDLVGAPLAVLAVERDKPEALGAMREAADRLGDPRIEFARVPTIYPAGGERQLVEVLTGQEVPSGDYPLASQCICQNVGTAYALDRLIRGGEPLTSRIVTVTGHGVANPTNVEVPIGTPIREVIEFCGGYRGEVALLILGGNMMGYALPSDDLPVTKAGNCILAAHSDEIRESFGEWPCIRCGDCADVCPARLLPQEILRASRPQDFDRLDALGLDDCIECGCCDVVCPSQIALTERFRQAKRASAAAAARASMADLAQERHQRKIRRLAAQAEHSSRQQDDLIAKISDRDRRAMIEAAVARASERRGESEKTDCAVSESADRP